MKNGLRRVAILIGVAAALGLVALPWLMPPRLAVTRPTRGDAVQAVYATGSVEASVTVRIAPQVGGRLVALTADEGDTVHAGQALGRLDDSDLSASLAELQAHARYARQQLERLQALASKGFVSADQIDQARSNLEAAQASVDRARRQRGFMTLLAPADGLVIRRDGEIGDFVPANQPVFYLARAGSPLRIDSDVDEEDIARIHVGQPVLIHADAFPDRTFTGTVGEITPKGDPVARSYRVRIALPTDSPLLIGMTAETNIVLTHHKQALLVPATALDGDHVWLLRQGRVYPQPVHTGVRGNQHVEILDGLADGDRVLAEPPAGLKAGQRVRVPAGGGA